jgi:hypothetical protein
VVAVSLPRCTSLGNFTFDARLRPTFPLPEIGLVLLIEVPG